MTTIFHLFPCLPVELRLVIWEFAIEPQALDLMPDIRASNKPLAFITVEPVRPPAIARACHEARNHLEKVYAKVNFSGDDDDERCTWFNPDIDTVSVNGYYLEELVANADAKLIRSLTVNDPCSPLWEPWLVCLLELSDTLKTVTFISLEEESETFTRLTQTQLEERWIDYMTDVLAALYWTCRPAPFHTVCYHPGAMHLGEITRDNFLDHSRNVFSERIRRYDGRPLRIKQTERYVNEAAVPWQWVHQDCECKNKDQRLGLLLLSKSIEEHPIDIAALRDDWHQDED